VSCARRLAAGGAVAASLIAAVPAAAEPARDRDVYAEVTTERITLGNAVAERSFELFRGTDEEPLGVVSSRDLRQGLTVELAAKDTAEVILIRRVRG